LGLYAVRSVPWPRGHAQIALAETEGEVKTLSAPKIVTRDTVKASNCVVQMGSQWLSEPYHRKVREIIRSGKLGKITRLEQAWNYNGPRWHDPHEANVADIREQDTDWKRWLLGKPMRPFDPRAYFEFRIFKDFSGGITDQWMSHGSGLCQFFLDIGIPDDMVANGGIFAWHDVRQNPDTFQALATYHEKELLYSFSVMFGNAHGDHTSIQGRKGTLYAVGGEGSPQWWFKAELPGVWRTNRPAGQKMPESLDPELVTIPGHPEIPPTEQSDDVNAHMMNWIECMRTGARPHGHIDTGFGHAVTIIMATKAYREGRKIYWDRQREEIVYEPPAYLKT
jgi:predicted dehydrogenase